MEAVFNPKTPLVLTAVAIVLPMITAVFFALLQGVRKKPAVVHTATVITLSLQFVAAFLALIPFHDSTEVLQTTVSAWFNSTEPEIKLLLGLHTDVAWVLMVLLGILLTIVVLYLPEKEGKKEEFSSWGAVSLLLTSSALALVLSSATLWVILIACFISFVSNFLLIATEFESHEVQTIIKKNMLIQISGFLLFFLGVIPSSARGNHWLLAAQQDTNQMSSMSGLLIWLGFIAQLIALLGLPSFFEKKGRTKIQIAYVALPTLIIYSAIWRSSNYWSSLAGLENGLGALLLMTVVLAILLRWRSHSWIITWFVSFFLVASYVSIFSAQTGMYFALSAVFGSFSYLFLSYLQFSQKTKWIWALLAWLATGGPLGLLWSALMRTAAQISSGGGDLIRYLFTESAVFLLSTLFLSKLIQFIVRDKKLQASQYPVYFSIVSIPLMFVFSWTGTLLGKVPKELDVEPLFSSWLTPGGRYSVIPEETTLANQLGWVFAVHPALFLLSFLLAYWIAGAGAERTEQMTQWFQGQKRRLDFLNQYGSAMEMFFSKLTRAVDIIFWRVVLPKAAMASSRFLSRQSVKLTDFMQKNVMQFARNSVVLPGKVLQLVQNGDIHWYASITVLATVVLFYKFLKGAPL